MTTRIMTTLVHAADATELQLSRELVASASCACMCHSVMHGIYGLPQSPSSYTMSESVSEKPTPHA